MCNKEVYLSRSEENIQDETLLNYIEYIWNTYCLYFSHVEDDKLYFYGTKKLKKPNLYINKDSKEIRNIKTDSNFNTLMYSYNDLLKSKDTYNVKEQISIKIKELQKNFYNEKIEKQNVIITNEGVGKSQAVLNTIKPGEIYSAPDKEILLEKEKYLHSIGKEYIRFASNGDIIFTAIYAFRHNEEIAKKIANEYIQMCKGMDRNSDKNNLSSEIIHALQSKNVESPKIEEKFEFDKDNSPTSLIKFLTNNKDIEEREKKAIMDYYNMLIAIMAKGTKVITTTTHKLKTLLENIKFKRRILVYCDEIIDDIHSNSLVLNKNLVNENTFKIIIDYINKKEDEDFLKQIKKLKKSRNAVDWKVFQSYINFTSLIEYKNNEWMEHNDTSFIILTTEEKAKLIFNNAIIHDYRHFIEENNIQIICIDHLNSTQNISRLFKGDTRMILNKTCAETIMGIKPENYIGNGIGHNNENNLPNIYNIRGKNNLFKKLKDLKEDIGITITCPHPEQINLHKSFKPYNVENDKEYEKEMIQVIINDQFHQTVGRLNGYRKTENKTYIFINSKLLYLLKPYYLTKNVFRYSNFLNQKYFRNKYPEIYKFFVTINTLLNMRPDTPERINNDIFIASDRLNIDKQTYSSFIKNLIERFGIYYENLQNWLKEKFEKIKYTFQSIRNVTLFIFNRHMELISEVLYNRMYTELAYNKSPNVIIKSKKLFAGAALPKTEAPAHTNHYCDLTYSNSIFNKDTQKKKINKVNNISDTYVKKEFNYEKPESLEEIEAQYDDFWHDVMNYESENDIEDEEKVEEEEFFTKEVNDFLIEEFRLQEIEEYKQNHIEDDIIE